MRVFVCFTPSLGRRNYLQVQNNWAQKSSLHNYVRDLTDLWSWRSKRRLCSTQSQDRGSLPPRRGNRSPGRLGGGTIWEGVSILQLLKEAYLCWQLWWHACKLLLCLVFISLIIKLLLLCWFEYHEISDWWNKYSDVLDLSQQNWMARHRWLLLRFPRLAPPINNQHVLGLEKGSVSLKSQDDV